MKKQFVVTQLAYVDITINAQSEDEAKEIAEDAIASLELDTFFDCEAIEVSDNQFYDISAA